ncbi:MAG: outer membrane protein assembly factor BamD, partial [Halioglobus sp.]|nr:outer membrane protein assembly factor BamD [Halioglobus sp.]
LAIAAVLVCFVLSACAGKDERDETLITNTTRAYETAQKSMANQNYRRAIQIFEALQARFPFSDLSKQIQLELTYAYYKSNQQDQAIDAADQFMRENPTHPRYDYALYIKALAYFERDPGMLERLFKRDVSRRPPRDGALAFSLLKRLVDRYPASPYAPDAEQRMVYLKNRLAAYENGVARFYLSQEAYVAALNRARNALEEYNGADSNRETLDIMIKAYEGLGMSELAADTRRVRDSNFPSGS